MGGSESTRRSDDVVDATLRGLRVSLAATAAVLTLTTGSRFGPATGTLCAIVALETAADALPPHFAVAIEALVAVAAVLLSGWAATPLLLLPASRAGRPVRRWAPAATLLPSAAVAALAAGDWWIGPGPAWIVAAAGVLSGVTMLAHPMLGRALQNARLQAHRGQWRHRTDVDAAVAGEAHTQLSGVVREIEGIREYLSTDRGCPRLGPALDDLLSALRRGRAAAPPSRLPDYGDTGKEPSSALVDRWARPEKLPQWLPRPLRELWVATLGSWLDSIRYLHTREIERVSLVGTLVLRAALLVSMPLTAGLPALGAAPFRGDAAAWRNAAWIAAAAWAFATAVLAPGIADRAMNPAGRTFRGALGIFESTLCIWLVLAIPSWLAFAMIAGPFNWFMRPTWRLRRLLILATAGTALVLAGYLAAPGNEPAQRLLAATALGLMLLFVISCSYGLMFPLVAAHVLLVMPSWSVHALRLRRTRWHQRVDPVRGELGVAIEVAQQESRASTVAAHVRDRLEHVRAEMAGIERTGTDRGWRHLVSARTLSEIVSDGLEHACDDPAAEIRPASPTFIPVALAGARVRSWRVGAQLEKAVTRIAAEAVRHGEDEVRCYLTQGMDDALCVRVENDLPVTYKLSSLEPPRPSGLGAREIAAAIERLPGGRLEFRGFATSEFGLSVFAVEFSLGRTVLEHGTERAA